MVALKVTNEVGPTGLPDPAQLFRKYYRSPNAHRQTGSGLGLYLSRSIIQMHSGDIQYTCNPHSVCFRITLPFTPN
jgi:signal transduction histidine kinase